MLNIKKYPFYIYCFEFFVRLFYILLSFFFCLLVIFYHNTVILLFETYPAIKFSYNKFLVTQIIDLFETLWLTCFYFSYLVIFPLVSFHSYCFFSNGWYFYQKKLFFGMNFLFWIIFLSCFLLSHYHIAPYFLVFLFQWEKKDISLFSIMVENRIYTYVNWILVFNWFFSFVFSFLITNIIFSFCFLKSNIFYNSLKAYKKIIVFLLVTIIFFLIPPYYEFLFQIFIILLVFLLYELLFFFSCIKIFQLNYKAI